MNQYSSSFYFLLHFLLLNPEADDIICVISVSISSITVKNAKKYNKIVKSKFPQKIF